MNEKNRPAGTGPAQKLIDKATTASIPETPDARLVPLIGHTVEKSLSAALSRLLRDEISLDELTPALADFFLAGHRAALASVLPDLTRVEIERDQAQADATRYYNAAFNPRAPIRIGPSYAELEITRHEIYSGGAK
ncbi:hypothetical protein [Cryobacterium sp. M91]|uniref:hypothetical protein n=1 Tax=Cryobacterium sp. M91 TaxID=2048294 RepID=UPI000CE3E159|nr:hypothetical protein [Cryobacterium sp. M91]